MLGKGFKKLLKEVAPLYQIPSPETLKHKLDIKYDVAKTIYKQKFSSINNFSVTCDIWSETMSMRSFLGVTVHYIQENKLISTTIEVHELTERHIADYIGEQLLEILSKWNIDKNKVVAVITDSAQNMVSAIIKIFDKQTHIPCFAHLLNLVVDHVLTYNTPKEKDAVSELREYLIDLINKVRKIVKWVKSSEIASDELRKLQQKNGVLEGNVKKIILDVKTRWNSTFYMLQRFIELCGYVNDLLLNKPHAPPMLTAVELLEVKEIISLMKPVEYMTVEASGEQYITISKIIPMVNCTANLLQSVNPELPVAKQLKTDLEEQLKRRFEKIESVPLIAVATVLDPRFKNIHFKNPLAAATAIRIIRDSIATETCDHQHEAHSDVDVNSVDRNNELSTSQYFSCTKQHKKC